MYNDIQIDVIFESAKGEIHIQENNKPAAHKIQIVSQAGRENRIHTRHRLMKTGKQRRNVREGDRSGWRCQRQWPYQLKSYYS